MKNMEGQNEIQSGRQLENYDCFKKYQQYDFRAKERQASKLRNNFALKLNRVFRN